jgi:hypothetical protein
MENVIFPGPDLDSRGSYDGVTVCGMFFLCDAAESITLAHCVSSRRWVSRTSMASPFDMLEMLLIEALLFRPQMLGIWLV